MALKATAHSISLRVKSARLGAASHTQEVDLGPSRTSRGWIWWDEVRGWRCQMSPNIWVWRPCATEGLLTLSLCYPRCMTLEDTQGLERECVGLRPGPWTLRDDPSHLHSNTCFVLFLKLSFCEGSMLILSPGPHNGPLNEVEWVRRLRLREGMALA